MIHPTVMFRRSYFEKAGLYPENTYFGEDTMMWAKGFKAGCQFANLPEYLLKFRLDPNFFNVEEVGSMQGLFLFFVDKLIKCWDLA